MAPCQLCPPVAPNRAILRRPKTLQPVCKDCFFLVFETEIHHTIMGYGQAEQASEVTGRDKGKQRRIDQDDDDDDNDDSGSRAGPMRKHLFRRGEKVAIGASGGKDSTVLAYVMKLLNERYDYGLDLCLLSIDEGISGYRDASLDTVKRNAEQYDMPLKILSYSELYGGWTMDKVVAEVGKKGNCTYCGVFRRQAIDRGANILDVDQIVTGHNADDVAETVLMNVLRGDLPRLQRCTAITTGSEGKPASSSSDPTGACRGKRDRTGADDAEDGLEADEERLDNLLPKTIKRSKPFKYVYEKEIVMYAYFKKLDYHSTECIYAPTAYRGYARALVKDLEAVRPSAIVDLIYSGEAMAASLFLRGRRAGGELDPILQAEDRARRGVKPAKGKAKDGALAGSAAAGGHKGQVQQSCSRCGLLTSQPLCQACMLLEGLNKGVAKVDLQA
ncbi:hypothetical protein BMF94_0519 [Rhodotorula taiwanensis]|uniref:Cytoplasmic tRNA adenylyltransferase 1 n=1 Tax=Rhodotorula taiwanensis TaxID=741276 RepID=A0A2S5BHU5_9BASI|nr:hypothetical protein BMF94_0519 [Rhodotorula taiwanensis]